MIKHSLVAVLALASTSALAQGSFDFSRVPGLAAEPAVQIDLPGEMLRFLADVGRAADPRAADALDGIRGVRVLVYENLDDTASTLETIDEASRMLESEGWQRMVYVNDGDETVRMHVRLAEQGLVGMTVICSERGGEAAFINIDGEFDPVALGRIAQTIGMSGLFGAAGRGRIGGVSFP